MAHLLTESLHNLRSLFGATFGNLPLPFKSPEKPQGSKLVNWFVIHSHMECLLKYQALLKGVDVDHLKTANSGGTNFNSHF